MGRQSNAAKAAAKAAAAAAKVEATVVDAPVTDPVIEAPAVTDPAPIVDPAPVVEPPKVDDKPKKGAAVPLDKFIRDHEEASQVDGLVVTAISHPDAKERFHDGVYSGFPVTPGELSATYSDGSKH